MVGNEGITTIAIQFVSLHIYAIRLLVQYPFYERINESLLNFQQGTALASLRQHSIYRDCKGFPHGLPKSLVCGQLINYLRNLL